MKMKRFLTLLLTACMLMSLVAVTGSAATANQAYIKMPFDDGIQTPVKINQGDEDQYFLTSEKGFVIEEGATAENYHIKLSYPAGGVPTLYLKNAKIISPAPGSGQNGALLIGYDTTGTDRDITNFDFVICVEAHSVIKGDWKTYDGTTKNSSHGAAAIVANNTGTLTITGPGLLDVFNNCNACISKVGEGETAALIFKNANFKGVKENPQPKWGSQQIIEALDTNVIFDNTKADMTNNHEGIVNTKGKSTETGKIIIKNGSDIKGISTSNGVWGNCVLNAPEGITIDNSSVLLHGVGESQYTTGKFPVTVIGVKAIGGTKEAEAKAFSQKRASEYMYFKAGPDVVIPTEPPVTQPAATKPAATQPAATQPTATKPAATQPAATQPAATQPAATQPAATQPAATQPAATQPAATQPAATQPVAIQPGVTEPFATEPVDTVPGETAPMGETVTGTLDIPAAVLADRVLTEEEKKQMEQGVSVHVNLAVKDITEEVSLTDMALVEEVLAENILGLYLDITMTKQLGEAEPVQVTETTDVVTVTITVPMDLRNNSTLINRIYKMIHVHDGKTEILDAIYDARTGKLSFDTDAFSTYALVYTDVVVEQIVETTPPETQATQATQATQETLTTLPYDDYEEEEESTPVALLVIVISLLVLSVGGIVFVILVFYKKDENASADQLEDSGAEENGETEESEQTEEGEETEQTEEAAETEQVEDAEESFEDMITKAIEEADIAE